MKKAKVITCLIFLLGISLNANSQVLEILDAIGGSLLPKVVQGIKDIRDSGNESKVKVDRDVFNASINDLNGYVKGITTSLANDAKSLDAIAKMGASASLLYDDLGAMETFINGNLLEAVRESNNEPVKRQFALAFNRDFHQLKDNISWLKTNVLALEIEQSLKDDLVVLVDAIRSEQIDFDSFLTQSGVTQPTVSSKIEEIDNYLAAMKNSTRNVNEIKRAVQQLLSTLNSRLSSYVKAASSAKSKVDIKFDELLAE